MTARAPRRHPEAAISTRAPVLRQATRHRIRAGPRPRWTATRPVAGLATRQTDLRIQVTGSVIRIDLPETVHCRTRPIAFPAARWTTIRAGWIPSTTQSTTSETATEKGLAASALASCPGREVERTTLLARICPPR